MAHLGRLGGTSHKLPAGNKRAPLVRPLYPIRGRAHHSQVVTSTMTMLRVTSRAAISQITRWPTSVPTGSSSCARASASWSLQGGGLDPQGDRRLAGVLQLGDDPLGVAGAGRSLELDLEALVALLQAGDGRVLGLQLGQLAGDGPGPAGLAGGGLPGGVQLAGQLVPVVLELARGASSGPCGRRRPRPRRPRGWTPSAGGRAARRPGRRAASRRPPAGPRASSWTRSA